MNFSSSEGKALELNCDCAWLEFLQMRKKARGPTCNQIKSQGPYAERKFLCVGSWKLLVKTCVLGAENLGYMKERKLLVATVINNLG